MGTDSERAAGAAEDERCFEAASVNTMSGKTFYPYFGRGKGRAKARVRATPDHVPRDPDSPQCQRLGEETQAAQVQAGAGWGGPESAAPAPSRRLGEEGDCRLPLDCGLALRARAAGDRGYPADRPSLGNATFLSERLAADTVFVGTVGTVGRLKNASRVGNRRGPTGKKAPETCSAVARLPDRKSVV